MLPCNKKKDSTSCSVILTLRCVKKAVHSSAPLLRRYDIKIYHVAIMTYSSLNVNDFLLYNFVFKLKSAQEFICCHGAFALALNFENFECLICAGDF